MSLASTSGNISGVDTSVRGLIRKYSSDSDSSPTTQKPPVKKKVGSDGNVVPIIMENAIPPNAQPGAATGTPAASLTTPGQQIVTPINVTDFTALSQVLNQFQNTQVQMNSTLQSLAGQFTSFKDSITSRITNMEKSLSEKITEECRKVKEEVMLEVATAKSSIDAVKLICDQSKLDVQALQDRVKIAEDALAEAGALVPDFFPENTVIVSGVRRADSEDTKVEAQKLVDALTDACNPPLSQIRIVNAERTPARNNKPGLIKIQLPSRNDKINILRNKKVLADVPAYTRAFVRGSQSHTDRLIHINFSKILEETGLANRYRIAGNGRMVEINNENGPPNQNGYQQQHMPHHPPGFGPGPPPGPPGHFWGPRGGFPPLRNQRPY